MTKPQITPNIRQIKLYQVLKNMYTLIIDKNGITYYNTIVDI